MQTINFTRGVPANESFPVDEVIDAAIAALQHQTGRRCSSTDHRARLSTTPRVAGRWQDVTADRVLTGNGSLQLIEFLCLHVDQARGRRLHRVANLRSNGHDAAASSCHHRQHPARGRRSGHRGARTGAGEAGAEVLLRHPRLSEPRRRHLLRAKRKQIVELANKHGFLIVEDAPYRLLRYRGQEEPTLYSMAPDRTLHMSSFTKLIAPGVRTGFMIGEPEVDRQAREDRRGHLHLARLRRPGHHLRMVPPRSV